MGHPALQAAEKGRIGGEIPEKQTSGAKARVDYEDLSGTAEAVPFQNRTYSELP